MRIDAQLPTRKTLNSAAYSKFKLSAYSNLYESNIALTECGCGMIGPYKTPWCEMIKCSRDINIIHLWYKLDWLQDEIEKRSSYLGKFRRTEEAKHLLDLISMTTDEEDLFYPFAKAAMADVFDVLSQYITRDKCAFLWNEGVNSIFIPSLPNWDKATFVHNIETNGIYTSFFSIPKADHTTMDISLTIEVRDGNNTDTINSVATYDTNEDLWKIEDIQSMVRNSIVVDYYTTIKLISATAIWKSPITYKEGDWIDYNDKVYIALGSGNANNMDALLETFDFRHSIHYLLAFPKDWNINMIEPLDTAIFEALVARIIYKWLQYAYPDEAKRYLNEWEECLQKIMLRCNELYAEKIVKRIPRI